jgi:O-antigen/teichoic acid export membrane protein
MDSDNAQPESVDKSGAGSVASSSGLLFAARLATNSGYFVAVVLIAHALHPAGRGSVAFITVTALLIAAVSLIGLDNATIVYATRHRSLRSKLLANLLTVGTLVPLVLGGVVCLALFSFPGVRPHSVRSIDLAILLAGSVVTSISNCGSAYLVGCRRFRAKAFSDAIMPWSYALVLLVIYAFGHMTVTRAVAAWTGAQSLAALVYCAFALSIAGVNRPSWSLLRESAAFGVRSWAGSISTFLNARADQTIMGLISSEQNLGIYAVAVNASEIVLYLPSAVAVALLPYIAASPPKERASQTLRIARALVILTLVSILVAAIAGWFLIPPVFGHAYSGSVDPFLWLLPGALGFAFLRIFVAALIASDSPARASLGPTAALVTGIVFDFLLIPYYGAEGAAIAASLAFFVGGITAIAIHRGKVSYRLGELVPRRQDIDLIKDLARRTAQGARAALQSR